MKKLVMSGALIVASIFASNVSNGQDVVDVAMKSQNHTTLVAAVKAAGLVETLKGAGPFTIFAPTNAAFDKLPAGTLADLLKPENKAKLSALLTYHVIAKKITAKEVMEAIKNGKEQAVLTTVNGEKLTATTKDGKVYITDEAGNSSMVSATDLVGSNGVVHVVDAVLMP
jgi:uncharacterized surface protein with fasciclin (FAS1) repeats